MTLFSNPETRKDARLILILLIVVLPLFFTTPFLRYLWSPDEPRCAAIAKEMVLTGNWSVPHLNGALYVEKPPLYYWLLALSVRLWGRFSNAALLFPSLLSALGCLVVVYLFGKDLFNRRVGFLSALVLATSLLFLATAQFVRMDMPLTFFLTCALFCFSRGHRKRRGAAIYYLLFYVLLGMAFLTKGLIGILLPATVVAVFLALQKDVAGLKAMRPFLGAIVVGLVVAPWLIAAAHRGGGEYLYMVVIKASFGRAFNSFEHDRPAYYYLMQLPAAFFPWFPFLLGACIYQSAAKRAQRLSDNLLFLAVWFAAMFVLLSLASAKLGIYILPMTPAAALVVGKFWHHALTRRVEASRFERCFGVSYWLFCVTLLLFGIAMLLGIKLKMIELPNKSIGGVFILAGIIGWALWKRNRRTLAFINILATSVLLLAYSMYWLIPVMNAQESLYPLGTQLALLYKPDAPVGMYNCNRPSGYYYTGCYITMLESKPQAIEFLSRDDCALCVLPRQDFEAVNKALDNLQILASIPAEERELVIVSRCERGSE